MAGIYIHIPFCRSRCIYCGFYSTTSLELRQRYVEAVCREMEIRGLPPTPSNGRGSISTIYFGGGTPSQLTIGQLRQLFDTLYKYNKVEKDAEVTIEVNPDDVTAEFAEGLQQLPVNRVSMGAQTFSDERLRFLHRRHTASQVSEAVKRLRVAGIRNISVDLMYGFPGETLNDWQHDIDGALALDVEHLSAYCLTVEEGTELYKIISGQCTVDSPDEELVRTMYYTLIDRLEAVGFEHYEISNFAKPGYRSRHNSSYWNGTPYIGLGAAAHSFDGKTRSWNISDLQTYMEGMERGERRFESETLNDDTRYNDLVTVALRTREGLDLTKLSGQHREYCLRSARRYVDDGLLRLESDRLSLTRRGLFVSDMVMAELMIIK
jgi:oxygen-independent coproporphyrinogen-3 oxidase